MKKFLITICCVLCICIIPLSGITQGEFAKADEAYTAKSIILVDYNSGEVLKEDNADEKLPIASMVKMMTLLLTFEEMDKGNLTLDTKITTTENASGMGGSQVFIDPYVTYTAEQMIKSVIMASANDASVALAEHISGSEDTFVKKMNERNEVVSWTVALFQGESDQEPCHLTENIDVILSKRTVSVEPDTTYYEINQRRLPSGNNEAIDLTKEEYGKAILLTNQWRRNNGKGDTDTPSPHNIRRVRPASKGLLMLYLLDINTEDNVSIPGIFPAFMLSFSESSSAINDTVVTYQLNAVAERDYIKRMEGVD